MHLNITLDKNIIINRCNGTTKKLFSIDPITFKTTSKINLVTHAHRDHINLTKKSSENIFYTTEETKDIMNILFNYKFQHIELLKKFKIKQEGFDDLEFLTTNAGHVYGSKSIAFIDNNSSKKVLITSDIIYNNHI